MLEFEREIFPTSFNFVRQIYQMYRREDCGGVYSPGTMIKKDSVKIKLLTRQEERSARDEKCDTSKFYGGLALFKLQLFESE